MGNQCTQSPNTENYKTNKLSEIRFKRIHPVNIDVKLYTMLNKLQKIIQYKGTHYNPTLKWYEGTNASIYMYGEVQNQHPKGDCIFYLKNKHPPEYPVLIATSISEELTYSSKTLLIYSDYSYYFGSLVQSEHGPQAQGKGLLVTQDFIYEGDFKNGEPHGYGFLKTKNSELSGEFRNGEPSGQCVQRSKKGLFIGQFFPKIRKYGNLITPDNQVQVCNEQYHQASGQTIVEL